MPQADKRVPPSTLGCKCPVLLSQIAAELSRVSQQGSLWGARENQSPREAGEETEQGL